MKKPTIILFIIALLLLSSIKPLIQNKTTQSFEYKGINLVAPIKQIEEKTFLELDNYNINAVALVPYAFVTIEKASITYSYNKQWWGESPEGIKACIKIARKYRKKLMLKPHLWVNHHFYTGNLNFKTPQEWQNWEADYEQYILEYAQIAKEEGVELFCFGTELGNAIAQRPDYWFQLIIKIKQIYTGKLTYAANWDDFEKVPFWHKLDYIGIDAYFPLSDAENPTLSQLKTGWKKHYLKMETCQKKWNKKILFTEFGYRNSNFSAKEPWTENNSYPNTQAQVNAYQAIFDTFKDTKWFAGGFIWKWYADEYYKNKIIDFTPQEKPTLEIIKEGYR